MNKNEIKYRIANEGDLEVIQKIIMLNNVSLEKNENRGFLCHQPDSIDLRHRLSNGIFNQVALYNNNCIGFITAFSNSEAIDYINNSFLLYELEVFSKIKCKRYIWLDQLAISPPSYFRKKIGTSLIYRAIELGNKYGYYDFYGTVSIFPETNIASLEFLKKNGFKLGNTITLNNRKWVFIEYHSHKQING